MNGVQEPIGETKVISIESVDPDAVERLIGCDPAFVFERLDPRSRTRQLTQVGFGGTVEEVSGMPVEEVFARLRHLIAESGPADGNFPKSAGGGVLALLGYELLAGQSETGMAMDNTPAAVFFAPDRVVTIDHGEGRAWVRIRGGVDLPEGLHDALTGRGEMPPASSEPESGPVLSWTPTTSQENFVAFARAAHARMGPGEAVEGVVLSVRLTTPERRDPILAYRTLRDINPSSYMFLARAPSIEAWGATSLGLARLTERAFVAETDGATRPYDDESFVWTPSAKEIAEYDVVIGALKEALKPLAANGELRLDSEMEERRFFNLAHLFATISGDLAPDRDAVDLVRALSPHGAAVGHHRQPALDLIARSETQPRGPFAGSIAFFGADGSVDASAFTRSMWQTEAGMVVQAGAKVVPASIPEEEYRECVLKTLALRRCVEGA